MTTMTDEAPRRSRYYRADAPQLPPMKQRPIYVRHEHLDLAKQGAKRESLVLASYLRLAVERYLAQPKRIMAPNTNPRYCKRHTLRATDEFWAQMGFRAEQEETTRSGVVAAAIMLDGER